MRNLFAVQEEALRKSRNKPGFAFFLEQGLGKTGLTLIEFKQLQEEDKVDKLLVICPNSIKSNWGEEVKIWTSYSTGVWPLFDPRKSRETPQVFIMNYESIIGNGFEAALKFLQSGRVMLILDESTRIKSHTAQTTKKALLLAKYAPIRRVLTGTPYVQNVMDLWPQLRFIGELDGVNPYAFRNHFAVLGGYMGKQVVGAKNEAELHQLLNSCAFRAKKQDWLKDLPAKLPPVIRDIEMAAEQKIVYNEMKKDFFTMVQKNEISAPQVINQMTKLMQISRGFLYDETGRPLELVRPDLNPAIREVQSLIDNTNGKVIIVCVHRYATDLLRGAFPTAAYLVGEDRMEGTSIDEQKDKFNKDKKCRAIICQVSVSAHGHTLLGGEGDDRCSTVIFFENSFNLEHRLQMEDRCHRIGQTKAVSYFDIAASAMDRHIIKCLVKKENMAKAIIDAIKSSPL